MPSKANYFYDFGAYRIDPSRKLLLRDGHPVPLTAKALETLLVLVEHSEQVVSKDELMKVLWPDTFVEESNLTQHISMVRKALRESPQDRQYILTVPGRGYRFVEEVRLVSQGGAELVSENRYLSTVVTEETELKPAPEMPRPSMPVDGRRMVGDVPGGRQGDTVSADQTPHAPSFARVRRRIGFAIALVGVALLTVGTRFAFFRHPHSTQALTEKDVIVLADFNNNTGEPIFDDALQQALAVQLAQSPFLNILPEQRMRRTLSLMQQTPTARLTHDLALQVCQRTNSTAVLQGSISRIGSRYSLTLNTVNCSNGKTLANAQAEAQDQDHVLAALGSAATRVRTRLGELPASVEKYDVPIFEATTSSLDALRAFSFGVQAANEQGDDKAIPFFKQALAIDPNFVLAYARLGKSYGNVGEEKLAMENMNRAFAMLDRVSAPENFRISAMYYETLGDLTRAMQTDEQWARTYPSDPRAHFFLAAEFDSLGQYQRAVDEGHKVVELGPDFVPGYSNLGYDYLAMNRPDEAKAVWEEGLRHGDRDTIHSGLYSLAFFQNDEKGMAEQIAWGKQRVGEEDFLGQFEGETAAYFGHLQQAHNLWSRARESARRNGSEERATLPLGDWAITEAEFGNSAEAQKAARELLKYEIHPQERALTALTLARAGETKESAHIADILAKENPSNTLLNFYWLPVVRASIELHRGNAQKALDVLAPTTPYEFAAPPVDPYLYPVYVRGQAYLALKQGDLGAAEFQKIIDHRGLVLTAPLGALAHLWLGRARALQAQQSHGEEAEHFKVQARAVYQEFLSLWKDADPDIPILKQAKAEYAKLK